MKQPSDSIGAIVGAAPALREAIQIALRVAPTRLPVLVSGESGTGKELFARVLHDFGPAPSGPFVAVNCGTLPRELADSELFGHERGAFTGAGTRKRGWFEEADGGTLVLDEVGELPLDLQPKLLRVLETGRVRRVGGMGEVSVRVRVVALTLRELPREVEQGKFRLDLFHRLAGFELALPPLRQRRADIPALVTLVLDQLAHEVGPRTLDPEALAVLVAHDWPGNVRQLRNVLCRAALLCPQRIGVEALGLLRVTYPETHAGAPAPDGRRSYLSDADDRAGGAPADIASVASGPPPEISDDLLPLHNLTFDEIERSVYRWALRRNGGSRRRAARALGLARSTFCDKVKRHGLG